jgi:SAM-dependent methyltransferase
MPTFGQKLLHFLDYTLVRAPRGYGKPVPKDALDREYRTGSWDHFFSPDELPRNMVVLGAVIAPGPSPSVLDLGCGSGRMASLLAPYRPRRYLGVDLSSEGLARARRLGLPGFEFAEGNYETWRTQETFDAVLFNECLGYARDPAKVAAAFVPQVRPGGRMIISHFRFGNHRAVWRRLTAVLRVLDEASVTNSRGQTWDIKTLQPCPDPGASR